MMRLDEEWRPAPDFPEYEVSSFGRVRRVAGGHGATPGKLLAYRYCNDRYPRVHLSARGLSKQWLVHRLVAVVFLGDPPDPHMDAAHKDGDSNNPRLSNIRWSTRTENNQDKALHGTQWHGDGAPLAKLRNADIADILASPETNAAVARRYGVNPSQISRIRNGQAWRRVAGDVRCA